MKKNTTRRFTARSYNDQEFTSTAKKIASYLRSLSNRRSSGIVTADDVHTFLNKEGVRPQQVRTRLSFINTVLREPMFEQDGTTNSTRPSAKGRAISTWVVA